MAWSDESRLVYINELAGIRQVRGGIALLGNLGSSSIPLVASNVFNPRP